MEEGRERDTVTDPARDLLEDLMGDQIERNTADDGAGGNFNNEEEGSPQQISNPQVPEGNTPTMIVRTPSPVVGRKANNSSVTLRGTNADPSSSAKKYTPMNPGGLTMYERAILQKEERERKMKELEKTLMVDLTFTPSRGTNADPSSSAKKNTPRNRGGLTMYERTMLQKEEKKRKMKELEKSLMVDLTFTPSRISSGNRKYDCGNSTVSSIGSSPSMMEGKTGGESVFSRLYTVDTAASRARRHRTPTRSGLTKGRLFGTSTPKSASGAATTGGRSLYSSASRSVCTIQSASPRVEALFKSGEEKLRARNLLDEDESEKINRRIEDKALNSPGVCTFKPQTKWNLIAQRRKMASEEIERQADEARRSTPKIIEAEQEQKRRLNEESTEECTFRPKVKWDLIKERRDISSKSSPAKKRNDNIRQLSRYERETLERNRRYEELKLKECTFKPKVDWSKERGNGNDDKKVRSDDTDKKIASTIVSPQLASTEKIVRRDMVGDIENPISPAEKIESMRVEADALAQVELRTKAISDKEERLHEEERNAEEDERGKLIEAQTRAKADDERKRLDSVAKAKADEDHIERERQQQQENERLENVRIKRERAELERIENERLELERIEKKKVELIERERLEKARLKREELERVEQLRIKIKEERIREEEAERQRERLEKERLELERIEKEELELIELERIKKEELELIELERIEKEELELIELERIEKKKLELIELERIEKEELELIELERIEKEELELIELERIEKEKLERIEKEKLELFERKRLEKARLEREELERVEKEKIELIERDRLEKARLEREELERVEQLRNEMEEKRIREEKEEIQRAEEKLRELAEEKDRILVLKKEKEEEEEKKRIKELEDEEFRLLEEAREREEELEAVAKQKRLEAVAKAKADEEQERLEAVAKATVDEEQERLEAVAKATADEEQARLEAVAKAEKARIAEEERVEAVAKAKADEEQARLEAVAKAEKARIAEEERIEAVAKAKADEEQARLEAVAKSEKARIAEEERIEVDAKAKAAADEEQARLEAVAKANKERIAEEERNWLEAVDKARAEEEWKRIQLKEKEQKAAEAEAKLKREHELEAAWASASIEEAAAVEEAHITKPMAESKYEIQIAEEKRLEEEALMLSRESEEKRLEEEDLILSRELEIAEKKRAEYEMQIKLEEEALMLSREPQIAEKKRSKEEETQSPNNNRVGKWMSRLNLKANKFKANFDTSSEAATVGENNSNAFPKVLFDDGGEADSLKEPEIGSI